MTSTKLPRGTFTKFVHETASGFAVAAYDDRGHQYTWPLSERARRMNGCHTGFSRRPEGSDWQFRSRSAALACARRLYREQEQDAVEARETRAWWRSRAAEAERAAYQAETEALRQSAD